MSPINVEREHHGGQALYRIGGSFDRASAWALRDHIERDLAAEILLDFSLVRDFSDLAVAVLAHGLTTSARRVIFRGLRQHQLRIFRYCGVALEEAVGSQPIATPVPSNFSA